MVDLDLSRTVKGVDALLRARQRIEEFTDDRDCVLRVSLGKSGRAVTLSDGAHVAPDDMILRLHLWNEHLPIMPENGPNAAWAASFATRMRHSLALIAARLDRDPRLADIAAAQGAPAFPWRLGASQMSRIAAHFGFDAFEHESGAVHAFLDSILLRGLVRAFNPAGQRGRGVLYRRCDVWISRAKLLSRYGD